MSRINMNNNFFHKILNLMEMCLYNLHYIGKHCNHFRSRTIEINSFYFVQYLFSLYDAGH